MAAQSDAQRQREHDYYTDGLTNEQMDVMDDRMYDYLEDKADAEGRSSKYYTENPTQMAKINRQFWGDPKVQEHLFGVGNARYVNEPIGNWYKRLNLDNSPNQAAEQIEHYKQMSDSAKVNPKGRLANLQQDLFARQLFPTAGLIPFHLRLG